MLERPVFRFSVKSMIMLPPRARRRSLRRPSIEAGRSAGGPHRERSRDVFDFVVDERSESPFDAHLLASSTVANPRQLFVALLASLPGALSRSVIRGQMPRPLGAAQPGG